MRRQRDLQLKCQLKGSEVKQNQLLTKISEKLIMSRLE